MSRWPLPEPMKLALEPGADGQVAAWLISDANGAVTQRTLLLRLMLDPARLPPKAKDAQVTPRVPR